MQNSLTNLSADAGLAHYQAARMAAGGAQRVPGRKNLTEASEQFEAMFLQQMLQPMFDTVEVDKTFGGGSAETIWRSMMVEKVAGQLATSQSLGVAKMVRDEFIRMQAQSQLAALPPSETTKEGTSDAAGN